MKSIKCLFLIVVMLCLCACGSIYPEMGDDAIAFEAGEFYDENYEDISYLTIEYNGRIYMPYGPLTGKIKKDNISKCIGYIIEDEAISAVVNKESTATRVYTLTGDEDNNYLMVYYVDSEIMNQTSFFRALDTKGEEIETPSFIGDYGDNYWD